MQTSRLLTFGVLASILLSSISLGYQLKTNKGTKFDKYDTPAHITELDHRFALANMDMVRNLTPMQDGIGIPSVWGLSDDNSHVIVRVFVSEKDLPSSYDRRKKAFKETAMGAAAMVSAEFDGGVHLDDIIVKLFSVKTAFKVNRSLRQSLDFQLFLFGCR